MTSPFYKLAREKLMVLLKPLGFHVCGRFYYRIVGDVTQQFCLLWQYGDFTVQVSVSSVYAQNNRRNMEGFELAQLIDGSNRWFGSYYYTGADGIDHYEPLFPDSSLKTLNTASVMCVHLIRTYLVPFFQAADRMDTAYRAAWQYHDIGPIVEEPCDMGNLGFLLGLGEWERAAAVLDFHLPFEKPFAAVWRDIGDALRRRDIPAVQAYLAPRRDALTRYMRRELDMLDHEKEAGEWEMAVNHIGWYAGEYLRDQALYDALVLRDMPFIRSYMEQRKAETYHNYKWKA